MSIYGKAYAEFLKKDIMLIIAIVLLFFSFGWWMGVPVGCIDFSLGFKYTTLNFNYTSLITY
ncbi:hypothetical protein [Viridibacillus arvi]|uniref:Uncharacterized protein n=1 Tax=Viridibacillus arvi TaxID=263475 RepID=A0A0M0LLT6_9BACL|nr:hypothetical protein [Viridibacillus arvi]KOO51683.1 hypothetical protein AMD00_04290 [Viridibacillus arvi]